MCDNLPHVPRDTPCDLCGSSEFRLLAVQGRRGEDLATVLCRICGLTVHARIPSDEQLTDYYRRQYRLDYHGEYVPSPHRVLREWKRGRTLLKSLSPFISSHDRIVEIGSGIGCTLLQFQRAGFMASGVEPGEGFRRYAIEQLGTPVRAGVLADLPHRPLADLILLVHVLEHLRSPTEALTHIRALLHDGGRCYIEVPNAAAPHAAPGKMFHFAHVHNFTPDTLGMLAAKVNFRVLRWLTTPGSKNLRVLLEGDEAVDWHIVPGSYDRARRAIAHSSNLRYYLRWSYVRTRLSTLVDHSCDRILAKRRVRKILQPRSVRTPSAFRNRARRAERGRSYDGSGYATHSS